MVAPHLKPLRLQRSTLLCIRKRLLETSQLEQCGASVAEHCVFLVALVQQRRLIDRGSLLVGAVLERLASLLLQLLEAVL